MSALLSRIFLVNWTRKLVAFFSAIVIWFLVNQSMTVTKTFPNIPVRIINFPPHKTVSGLLPTGYLIKKIPLTMTGDKGTIEELKPIDMEIVINVESKEESFIARIDKKNLSFISKDEKLKNNISLVSSDDLFIKVTNLVTDEVPLRISSPKGEQPNGFQILDVSPKILTQKVCGPQEDVEELKKTGLELTFDLDKITKEELEAMKTMHTSGKSNEITFFVPASWKKVPIPFHDNTEEPLNDPKAQYLRIDFLKEELIPLDFSIPVTLFFPVKDNDSINPNNHHLERSELIVEKYGFYLLNKRVFVAGVSRHFLDIVKDNLTIGVVVTAKETLEWSPLLVDENDLEKKFLASFQNEKGEYIKYSEDILKKRFRSFVETLKLVTEDEQPLSLTFTLEKRKIHVK